MTVSELDEHCAQNPKPFAVNRYAPSTDSTVEPMDDTDDDTEKVAMADTDDDKENGAKTATLEPVKETISNSSIVVLRPSFLQFTLQTIQPLVEWQTSQVHSAAELLPSDVSRFLSIKIASSYRTKFYFWILYSHYGT